MIPIFFLVTDDRKFLSEILVVGDEVLRDYAGLYVELCEKCP